MKKDKSAKSRKHSKEKFEIATVMFANNHTAGAKTCVRLGSKPGYIKICKVDPGTGACTGNCDEFPDPGGRMLSHVLAIM